MEFDVLDLPWMHGFSENFISENFAKKIEKEFPSWDCDIWDKYGKVFDTPNGFKKMLTNQSVMPKSISNFIDELKSKSFIALLEQKIGIPNLIFDEDLYGGGLFIHPEGSFLNTHVDFNFNNDIKLYRAINLLFYANLDFEGGEFVMYNTNLEKQKSISPKLNTCILFPTTNHTYHGVNKIKKGYRKLISIWFYTKKPIKNVSETPHRTIWVK